MSPFTINPRALQIMTEVDNLDLDYNKISWTKLSYYNSKLQSEYDRLYKMEQAYNSQYIQKDISEMRQKIQGYITRITDIMNKDTEYNMNKDKKRILFNDLTKQINKRINHHD